MFTFPAHIGVAFSDHGEETGYKATLAATGGQLAVALHHEKDIDRHHALNDLWRRFRHAGGKADDQVGQILKIPR